MTVLKISFAFFKVLSMIKQVPGIWLNNLAVQLTSWLAYFEAIGQLNTGQSLQLGYNTHKYYMHIYIYIYT